ncbi:MAG: zinc-binding protein [Xanthomonadaceae bacterium]|nr:zinc-binding protein [Xanthomonadaceae bacterium]
MSCTDCSDDRNIMIVTCSGGSHAWQLANYAVRKLTREGFGQMFCLANNGTNINEITRAAKDADKMIVLDGCATACGKTILENAGVPVTEHVIVTHLDIKKKNMPILSLEDVEVVKHAVRIAVRYPVTASFSSPKPLSPAERAFAKMFSRKCC